MYAKWLRRVDDLLWIEVVAKGSLCRTLGKLLKLSVLEVPHLRAHGGVQGGHYSSRGAAKPRA